MSRKKETGTVEVESKGGEEKDGWKFSFDEKERDAACFFPMWRRVGVRLPLHVSLVLRPLLFENAASETGTKPIARVKAVCSRNPRLEFRRTPAGQARYQRCGLLIGRAIIRCQDNKKGRQ